MLRSASNTSNVRFIMWSRASGTVAAVVTSNPSCFRIIGRVSLILGSSSTNKSRLRFTPLSPCVLDAKLLGGGMRQYAGSQQFLLQGILSSQHNPATRIDL